MLSLYQNHIYTVLPYVFGGVPQSYVRCVFWAVILILPPVKLNWQRSHCVLFKSAACWNHSYDMHLSCLGPVSCAFTPEFPRGSSWGVAAVWWLLDNRCSFLSEFPQGSPAYISWWLQLWLSYLFLTDKAESIPLLGLKGHKVILKFIANACRVEPTEGENACGKAGETQAQASAWIPQPNVFRVLPTREAHSYLGVLGFYCGQAHGHILSALLTSEMP